MLVLCCLEQDMKKTHMAYYLLDAVEKLCPIKRYLSVPLDSRLVLYISIDRELDCSFTNCL